MANFTALAAARRAMTPGNVREDGLGGDGRPSLVVYASDQVHHCVDKAVDLLGIGTNNLRRIETDDRFRIRMDLLERAIVEDRKAGRLPAIVVGKRGHRKHRRDRSARGACGPLPPGVSLVSRRRRLRRARRALARARAALRRPRARRLDRRRPAQVALRPLRGRGDARPGEGAPRRDVPQVPGVPRVGPREPVPRSGLVRGAGRRALPRVQGAEGLDGPDDPRARAPTRGRSRTTSRSRVSFRRKSIAGRTSSAWRRRCSRSRTSATGRRTRDRSRTTTSTA